jgi:hypothetical protein
MTSDTWMLPNRQRELPFRETLSAARLHRRREATFLALAGMFLVATAAMFLLPASAIDLAATLEQWTGVAIAIDLELVLGVLALPVTLGMLVLVRELFGPARARALIVVGTIAALGLAGISFAAGTMGLGLAFALAAAYLAIHTVALVLCSALSRRSIWLRANLATVLAQLVGWAAFGGVWYLIEGVELAPIASLALGAAAVTTLGVLAATPLLAIAAHVLAIVLRVGRGVIVEETEAEPIEEEPIELVTRKPLAEGSRAEPLPQPQRDQLRAWHPDTRAEMRFFTEGDALEDSASNLPAARA